MEGNKVICMWSETWVNKNWYITKIQKGETKHLRNIEECINYKTKNWRHMKGIKYSSVYGKQKHTDKNAVPS
jgi:hypothetical protein